MTVSEHINQLMETVIMAYKNINGRSNHAVARRWADGVSAKRMGLAWASSNGNCRFQGDILYSYRTPIGRLLRQRKIALLTSHSYSVTTSGKHMGPARFALRNAGYETFHVDDIMTDDHELNLRALVEQYRSEVQRLIQRRVNLPLHSYLIEHLSRLMQHMIRFQHVFKLSRVRLPDLQNDVRRIEESRQRKLARFNSPKEVEKRVFRKAKQNLKELVFGDEA